MADRRGPFGAIATAAILVLSTGCGGAPSKAEFTARMRESIGDLDESFASKGIDAADGRRMVDRLLDCQYDALAGDEDLLQRAYERPGDVDVITKTDVAAAACVTELNSAITAAERPTPSTSTPLTSTPLTSTPANGGGSATTTTTAPPVAPPSTPTSGG